MRKPEWTCKSRNAAWRTGFRVGQASIGRRAQRAQSGLESPFFQSYCYRHPLRTGVEAEADARSGSSWPGSRPGACFRRLDTAHDEFWKKRYSHVQDQDYCSVRGRPGHGPRGCPPVRPGGVPGGPGGPQPDTTGRLHRGTSRGRHQGRRVRRRPRRPRRAARHDRGDHRAIRPDRRAGVRTLRARLAQASRPLSATRTPHPSSSPSTCCSAPRSR